jgi:plasmid stabilization system protein ParE
MDARQQPLTVIYAPSARIELNEIWDYNERTYNSEHAAAYVDFLLDRIDALAINYAKGRTVEEFPGLQAMTLKRSSRGYAHIVIYRVDLDAQVVRILHIYHTAQDVAGRLRQEFQ